jgi:NAD(P)-dependent dehydrogenase (short-subunit alcohol dehydrogenase family)
MPGMPSEPGQDQPADPAAPGRSRAGQVAVVTGGSAGLGLAIAAALAQADTTVVLASRSAERCTEAAARLSARTGTAVHGRACNVTDERAIGALTEAVLAEHGRIDVLVTSAGIQARGTVDQLAVADLRACLEVNVVGTWLACRAAAPMRAAGYGRILTMASALGLAGAAARTGTRPARAPWPSSPAAWPSSWPAPGSPSTPWPPAYPNLIYFNEVDRGNHFAAWQEPALFTTEVCAAFRSLR